MMFLTEKQIRSAMDKGYSVTQSPRTGTSAENGNRHIWDICINNTNLKMGYQTADIAHGRYDNHKAYDTFEEAIARGFGQND